MKSDSQSLTDMVKRQLRLPVDVKTLKFAIGVFQEAARGRLHNSHIPPAIEPGFHLKNIPLNRGMLAILEETQHLGDDDSQALMVRVMHFGATILLVADDSRFQNHVRTMANGHEVSDEFMDAFAKCKFHVSDDHILADLDEMAALISGKDPTDPNPLV